MQDHKNPGGNFHMLWMMVLCCVLPIVALAFFGGTGINMSPWLIFGLIAVFCITHFWTMGKKHHPSTESKDSPADTQDRPHHGCHET